MRAVLLLFGTLLAVCFAATHPAAAGLPVQRALLGNSSAVSAQPAAQQAAAELVAAMLHGPYFVEDESKAPWTIGYWQEANLCETFANFLLSNASSSSGGTAIDDNRSEPRSPSLGEKVAETLKRSFEHYPAQWLISNAPEKDSYDDLLWWALAYLRAHELCTARPDLLSCTVRLPLPKQQPCTCMPCGSRTPHNFTAPGSQCSPATAMCGASSGPPSKSAGTCYTSCAASCSCPNSTCTVEVPDAGAVTTLLEQGKLIFDYAYNASWNTDYCQGGFAWSLTSQNYKNCVTNQLGILTASKLGRLLSAAGREHELCNCKAKEAYSVIAKRTAAWLERAPMRNASTKLYKNELYCSAHNVSAGRVTNCTGTDTPIWTYCQGLPLGFDVELHRLTGDSSHLGDAFVISSAVQKYMTVPARWSSGAAVAEGGGGGGGVGSGAVLMESACTADPICTWVDPPLPKNCKCDNNAMIYKGILSRYLGYLHGYAAATHPAEAATIRAFLLDNVNSVLANNKATTATLNRNDAAGNGRPAGYGMLWQGPVFGLVDSNAGNLNQAVLDLLLSVAF